MNIGNVAKVTTFELIDDTPAPVEENTPQEVTVEQESELVTVE